MNRTYLGLAATLTVGVLALTGCSSGQGDSDPTPQASSAGGTIGLPTDMTLTSMRDTTLSTLKGKTVIFVPQGLGAPIHDSQNAEFKLQFAQLGIDYEVLDGAFDPAKQVAAVQSAIQKKPDVLVVVPLDPQLLAKLLKQAQDAGIYVVQDILQSSTVTDAYVGPDFETEGEQLGEMVAKQCAGQKVAMLHALPDSSFDITTTKAFKQVAADHDMDIVSDQSPGLDAGKASSMAESIMQQNPDLCGLVGTYDETMIGAGNAVEAAGKSDKVGVWTLGGGNAACQGIKDGLFSGATGSAGPRVGIQSASMVQMLLESGLEPGASRFVVYTPTVQITPDNYWTANLCYDVLK